MKKLKKVISNEIDKVNRFSPYDTNRECERAKMNDKISDIVSMITEDIAVKFNIWMRSNDTSENAEKYCNFSDKDMFQEFLKELS